MSHRMKNFVRLCEKHEIFTDTGICFKHLCRALPKGAAGLSLDKPLHDDGNSAVVPGIWRSMASHPSTVECGIQFMSRQFSLTFRACNGRLSWFLGWVPHKTFLVNAAEQNAWRLHHSSFSKVEFEDLGIRLFCPEKVNEYISLLKEKKHGVQVDTMNT